jgi:HSP20 family protein
MSPARGERRPEWSRPSDWSSSPFNAMQRMVDEMDRIFGDFGFGRRWGARPFSPESNLSVWAPEVDVFQKNNELTIKADLPGLKREDVQVDITDSEVTIQGERRHEREEEREGFYRSERGYGSFCRVIPLPEGTISDQAKATFKDGVLEITMPAPPATTKGRRLEITEGAARK